MKKTICFLRLAPTSPLHGSQLNPWWYHENNFNVLFWDISRLFFKIKTLEKYKVHKNYFFTGPNNKIFENKNELINELDKLDKNTIILYFNRNPFIISNFKDDWLIKQLRVFKKLGLIQFDTRPLGNTFYQKFKDIYRIYKNRYLSNQLNPKFFISVGKYGEYWSKKIYPKSKSINVASPLINWHVKTNKNFKKFILFIEESFINQPDAKMYDEVYCNDTKNYHKRMNAFFDFVETKTGKKVIIGASGRYFYDNETFNGRKIIYNKTLELISNSYLTIGHCSLALYQVVLYNTPLLLVNDSSFTSRQIIENLYSANILESNHINNTERSWKKIEKIIIRSNKLNNKIIKNFFDSNISSKVQVDYKTEIKKYFDII